MSKEYLIKRNNKENGPFTFDELKGKILTKDTLVFSNADGWLPVEQVPELKDIVRQTEDKKAIAWLFKPTSLAAAGLLAISGVGYKQYESETSKQLQKIQIEERQTASKDSTARAIEKIKADEVKIEKLRTDQSNLETEKIAIETRLNNIVSSITLANQEKVRVQEFQLTRLPSEKEAQIRQINSEILQLETTKNAVQAEKDKNALKLAQISTQIMRIEKVLESLNGKH